MTLHFIHIGKTGGTAIKEALKGAGLAYWREPDAEKVPETPYGRIKLHHHGLRLEDLPPDDYVFFCLRDPIARFVSAFCSRANEGRPRYHFKWTPAERTAFEAFPTPQRLATALASDEDYERRLAHAAMRDIKHLGFMQRHIGTPEQLRTHLSQVVYIGRQETLNVDWEQIRSLLGLPAGVELSSDPIRAHRRDPSQYTALDATAVRALRDWYARDYRLVTYCDRVRANRSWGAEPGAQPTGRSPHRYLMRRAGIVALRSTVRRRPPTV